MSKNVDVAVIGAGQAGLAIGYYLKQSNLSFVLLEASGRVGDVWKRRYDSLILFSPRKYSVLPGLKMKGDLHGFPSKDELADYLKTYAEHFSLPVILNAKVKKLKKTEGKFRAITAKGEWTANQVVIATGPFQKPAIPPIHKQVPADVFQLHSSDYQRPSQLQEGNVLVIGSGNSGAQIAAELSATRDVAISTGHEPVFIPRQIWKRSIFWWLDVTGLSRVSVDSRLAKVLQKTEPVIGMELKSLIEKKQVQIRERTISFQGRKAEFKDGSNMEVDNIIWATGFCFDYSWINIPGVIGDDGKAIHQKGISPVEGVYFLGLPWLSRVGSAQLNGINYDARRLFRYLSKINEVIV